MEASGEKGEKGPQSPSTSEQPKPPTGEQPKPATGEQRKPATGEQQKPATGEQAAAPDPHSTDPHERIDGLRAWVAQVNRKLGIRTYAFAAASVLALAAAAVAIVFALQLQEDSATNDDLDELRNQIGAVEKSAS